MKLKSTLLILCVSSSFLGCGSSGNKGSPSGGSNSAAAPNTEVVVKKISSEQTLDQTSDNLPPENLSDNELKTETNPTPTTPTDLDLDEADPRRQRTELEPPLLGSQNTGITLLPSSNTSNTSNIPDTSITPTTNTPKIENQNPSILPSGDIMLVQAQEKFECPNPFLTQLDGFQKGAFLTLAEADQIYDIEFIKNNVTDSRLKASATVVITSRPDPTGNRNVNRAEHTLSVQCDGVKAANSDLLSSLTLPDAISSDGGFRYLATHQIKLVAGSEPLRETTYLDASGKISDSFDMSYYRRLASGAIERLLQSVDEQNGRITTTLIQYRKR